MDTIVDTVRPGEGNRIRFGAGIAPNDLTLSREGTTLRIGVGTGGDAILLPGFNPADAASAWAVAGFVFENDTEVAYADLARRLLALQTRDYDLRLAEDGTLTGTVEVENAGAGVVFSVKEDCGHGEFTLNPDGTWQYRPVENYSGADRVVVEVINSYGASARSTIGLTVLPTPQRRCCSRT